MQHFEENEYEWKRNLLNRIYGYRGMMVFNRSASLENMLIAFLIVLAQIGFDRLRREE